MSRRWLNVLVMAAVSLVAAPAPPSQPATTRILHDDTPGHVGPTTPDDLAHLARTDAVRLLDVCRRRFKVDARQYRVTMHKQERIRGVLHPQEEIALTVREEPYAVLMIWRSGARKVLGTATEGALFVAGENDGKVKVWRPTALLATYLDLSPTDRQPRESARYAITEAGLGHVAERTYRAWARERELGRLQVEYLGMKPVPEVGGRICHIIRRTCLTPTIDPFVMTEPPPDVKGREQDAAKTITLMIDAERGFQVGSVLRREDGELVGAYYYRDLELNPKFSRDQFTQAAFKK